MTRCSEVYGHLTITPHHSIFSPSSTHLRRLSSKYWSVKTVGISDHLAIRAVRSARKCTDVEEIWGEVMVPVHHVFMELAT